MARREVDGIFYCFVGNFINIFSFHSDSLSVPRMSSKLCFVYNSNMELHCLTFSASRMRDYYYRITNYGDTNDEDVFGRGRMQRERIRLLSSQLLIAPFESTSKTFMSTPFVLRRFDIEQHACSFHACERCPSVIMSVLQFSPLRWYFITFHRMSVVHLK